MPLCTSNIKKHGAARATTELATNKELCFFYCKNKHNLNFIRSKRQLNGYKFDGAKCRWYSLSVLAVSFVVKVTVLYEDINT